MVGVVINRCNSACPKFSVCLYMLRNEVVFHFTNFVWIFGCLMQVAVAVMVSWLIFRNPIPALNAFGCGITLVGCTFYGYVRHMFAQQPPGTPKTPRTPHTPRSLMEMLPLVNDKLDDKV